MNTLSAELQAKRAFAALNAHRYQEAAAEFRRALELDRDRGRRHPEMRYLSYYGLCLAKAGLSEKIALEACRKALSRQKRDPVLYLNLGRVHLENGKFLQALEAFQDGLRLVPDHPVIKKELAAIERRSRPAIPYLSRSNTINVWLGRHRRGSRRGSHQPVTSG